MCSTRTGFVDGRWHMVHPVRQTDLGYFKPSAEKCLYINLNYILQKHRSPDLSRSSIRHLQYTIHDYDPQPHLMPQHPLHLILIQSSNRNLMAANGNMGAVKGGNSFYGGDIGPVDADKTMGR
jgi:hypothetical protein